jgi:hypothetical protein
MMKHHALSVAVLGFAVALFASAPVSAAVTPIPITPTWDTRDEYIGIGGYFSEQWLATITGTVRVTDLYVPGDNYNIFKNGSLVATTSSPDCTAFSPDGCIFGGSFYTSDPNAAWTLPQFAHASFLANAGDQITIQAISIPTGYTDSTVAISQAVPEPSTWAMMLIGFAGLGFAGYQRAKAVPAA